MGAVVVIATVGCCVGAYLVTSHESEERHALREVPCEGLPLRLVHVHTVTNPLEGVTRDALALEIGDGDDRRDAVVDARVTPYHLPAERRPPASWRGESESHVHFFLDPAEIDADTASRAEACIEADIEGTLAAIAGVPFVIQPIRSRGRIYWRARESALEVRFVDGDRSIVVLRGGEIALDVTNAFGSHGSLIGRARVENGQVVVGCCDSEYAALAPSELPRFRDAAGRDLEGYFGVPIETDDVHGQAPSDRAEP